MSAIVLLDTSIYLNILKVPGFNMDAQEVFEEFKKRINVKDSFLLPFATILETGNHISRISDGRLRRVWASNMVKDVEDALNGIAPYRPTSFPDREEFLSWLKAFPDNAMRTKKMKKDKNEGGSLSDLTIIKEWDKICKLHPMSRVSIWSLDEDLKGYDRMI
jgi:hypothetical protein